MNRTTEHDSTNLTAFRMEQLATAFDRVRDPRDWKAPIESVIPVTDRSVVEQAVLTFTQTRPTFAESADTPDRLMVRAPGYRCGPLG